MKAFIKTICALMPLFVFAANTPPKVDGGTIKRLIYPTSTTILTGSGSDAEGPVTFKWKQVGGNTVATIAQPTNDTTAVSNLKPGLYTFLLTVTDKTGTSRSDTAFVTVLQKVTWTIGKSIREALVHPATGGSGPAPLILAFHGHGGTDLGWAERAFEIYWPEAVVVYPQGLKTKTQLDSNCNKPGWQFTVGEVNCRNGAVDQDLKFFDTMLVTFKRKFNADLSLVFAHGWSNGGEFLYDALWSARASKLAGLSIAGASLDTILGKKPKPVMHIAGTLDSHVPFADQEQDTKEIRALNKCSANGTVWATGPAQMLAMHYNSRINDPVVFLQYDDGHIYPFTVPPYIVKFFKEIAASKTTAPLITKVYPAGKFLSLK